MFHSCSMNYNINILKRSYQTLFITNVPQKKSNLRKLILWEFLSHLKLFLLITRKNYDLLNFWKIFKNMAC